MSQQNQNLARIAKTPIEIPEGVKLSIENNKVEISGKLGTLVNEFNPAVEIIHKDGKISFVQMRPVTSFPIESFYDQRINGKDANLWDNSNIIESYSGVTSPFTFSYASHAYHQVYRQFALMMKVPEEVILDNEFRLRNMLGLVRGRIYYNLINWYRLLMMMPGSAGNPSFMETMMGVKKTLSSEHQKVFDFMKIYYFL